jgi:HPr kinase/phosphorylase
MAAEASTIHASAVLVGARAILIRGPSGAGKSQLVLALLNAAAAGRLPFARLVSDDRTHVTACHGRLLIRPAEKLQGLLEIRGLGIRSLPFEPVAVAGLVVDLAAVDAERLPGDANRQATIGGITVARLAVAPGADPLLAVLAAGKAALPAM